MKRILTWLGIILLAFFVMTAVGPLFGIIGGIFCFMKFREARSTSEKVAWAVGGIFLITNFTRISYFITGLLALGALYEIFKDKKASATYAEIID